MSLRADLRATGVMTMRQILMPMGALCVLLMVGLAAPMAAPAFRDQGACNQIKTACQNAGFEPGGARVGNGLQVDCVGPIMHGSAQPRRARKPLPQVDPQLVAACQASSPRMGPGKAPPPEPVAQPVPPSPPAPVAAGQ